MDREPREAAGVLTIGELAAITGTAATALRFYEQRGLLMPVARVGGQRRYDASSVARLMVITFCRIAGLTLDEIAVVVNDESPGRTATRDIAERQVADIDEQIARLKLARAMMTAVTTCTSTRPESCECGAMAPVIRRLRRHLGRPDPTPS